MLRVSGLHKIARWNSVHRLNRQRRLLPRLLSRVSKQASRRAGGRADDFSNDNNRILSNTRAKYVWFKREFRLLDVFRLDAPFA